MNGLTVVPLLLAFGALLLAALERAERRRAEAELERWKALLTVYARAHAGTNGTVPDWRWPPAPYEEEKQP
jgi:hypothetical protein